MISNKGFDEAYITMKTDTATVGYPVTVSANGTVKNAAASKPFIGLLYNSRSDIGAVQVKGYAKLKYTGDIAPNLGFCSLLANGSGGVTAGTGGLTVRVLSVNTTDTTVEFLM